MRFYKHLYVSESISGKEAKICRKMKRGMGLLGVEIITLNSGTDLLDIYPGYVWKQRHVRKYDFKVVGLAKNHQEAIELSTEIVSSVYQKTGSLAIKDYFKEEDFLSKYHS